MVYTPMDDVTEFHDKFHRDGKGRHDRPISVSDVDRRMALIGEEAAEVDEVLLSMGNGLVSGYDESDYFPELAKELADLLYVVYGTAEEFGIPLEAVFKEVHHSNMSKIWSDGTVHYREDGKVLKPPTYYQADVEGILYGRSG